MNKNPTIKRLLNELSKKYQEDEGWFFCDRLQESGAVQEEFSNHLDAFYFGRNFIHVAFEILAHFSFERSIYAILSLKDKDRFIEECNRASTYGYAMLTLGSKSCKCFKGRGSVPMHRTTIHFALNILTSEWKNAKEIGDRLISSVNAENCIIQRGDIEAYSSWFILKLYSIVVDKEINTKRALYPKENFTPYDTILENWDSIDMDEIDTYVTLLSNTHLSSAHIPMTEANEEKKRYKLELSHIQLLPYEILIWLKLRELKGLKNPKTFTHPLMNTPIAKMFLNIKEPLPYPQELPYAKELLEKLKEQCPDVEIPEWLKGGESDGLDRKEAEINKQNNAKGDDIIPDDFFAK